MTTPNSDDNLIHVGFTGTRDGLTFYQRDQLREMLRFMRVAAPAHDIALHHGDCTGADAQVAAFAQDLGYKLISHPPDNPRHRANHFAHEVRPEKPYLERNKDIVRETSALVAAPKGIDEQVRSGTWSTVRYATKLGKQIYIVYPDGQTVVRNGHEGSGS